MVFEQNLKNNYWSGLWMYNEALYKPWAEWSATQFGLNFGGNTRNFQNFGFNTNLSLHPASH